MSIAIGEAVPASRPGISWAAVFAGAVVATAVTVMLMVLGSGLGLAAVSTDTAANPGIVTFGVWAAIWLIVVQWVSAFFGGYIAGRLRPNLSGIHADEVGFRDTASGLAAWAVAALLMIGAVGMGASSALGTAGQAVGSAMSSVAGSAAANSDAPDTGYLLDMMFRSENPDANSADAKAEAGRIMARGLTGEVSQDDRAYLARLVSARTGLPADQAGARVNQVLSEEQKLVQSAKEAAEAARKTASAFALYSFFSMLVGAFIAAVAGAIGGRQRDAF
ncbi:hypothetical protein IAI18_19845 [Acetobacteraceae bacterium H6797]|nr:hypothetical protein [Acetobacteraceae bacterium H6797]